MNRSVMVTVLVIQLCAGARLWAADVSAYLQFDALARLAAAVSTEDLERAREAVLFSDSAVDIVYAMTLYRLEPSLKAETLLLTSIPRNELEFSLFQAINSERCTENRSLKLCSLPDQYFFVLGEVVAKHPRYLKEFLRLSYFTDGYVAEEHAMAAQELHESHPEAFAQALAELPPPIARSVNVWTSAACDYDDLMRLAHAGSLEALERTRARISCATSEVDLVYALTYYRLAPGQKAERLLLASIPKNYVDTVLFGRSVHGQCIENPADEICVLENRYLSILGEVVARHPKHFGEFLRLSSFLPTTLKAQLASINQKLYLSNPSAFEKALAALPPAMAREVVLPIGKD